MLEDEGAGPPETMPTESPKRESHTGARLVSLSEAARVCVVSRRTLDRWIAGGKLRDLGDGATGRRVRLDEAERLAGEARRMLGNVRTSPETVADGEVETLRARVGELEDRVRELSQDRDRWAGMAERLETAITGHLAALAAPAVVEEQVVEGPKRRSWWPWRR